MPRREDWLLRPWRRLVRLLAVIVLYTIPVATALLWSWRLVTGDMGSRPYALTTALFAIVGAVVVITHVYETVFLLKDWESDRLRRARTEQARLQTELESLGREVDPHFLFNSLNTLSHLVDRRSEAAAGFITNLGATYRYVLESRGRLLVPLAEELRALERHRALADISYRGGVHLDVDVEPADAERLWLPPVSLAELFQNALKHNTVGPDRPMRIHVRLEETTLVFENEVAAQASPARSTGFGLANLAERFRLTIGVPATWERKDGRFVVRLPLAESGAVRTAPDRTL
jgi:LytS/YehU family sensor histidine kinase